jgi:hypothetical protein
VIVDPAVCSQSVGCGASKTTLCTLSPSGYLNHTRPPGVTLTALSSSDWPASWNLKSMAMT